MPVDEARYVWEGRVAAVLFWIAGVLFALAFAFGIRGGGASAWRLTGGLLELYGLLLGVGVRGWKWIKATGARTPEEWVRDLGHRAARAGRRAGRALQQRFHGVLVRLGWAEEKPEPQTISGRTAEASFEARPASISISEPPELDLEGRVERLEQQLKEVRRQVKAAREEARRRAQGLEDRLESVSDELRETDRRDREELGEQIREMAVGSLRWEYVAIAWFVVGVLVTTWAGVLPDVPVPA